MISLFMVMFCCKCICLRHVRIVRMIVLKSFQLAVFVCVLYFEKACGQLYMLVGRTHRRYCSCSVLLGDGQTENGLITAAVLLRISDFWLSGPV